MRLWFASSNLFYDFDHYEPQSAHPELSNKASNLGLMMADENRRKQAAEFTSLPKKRAPISLTKAFKEGEKAATKAVGEMLGGRTFSEVSELNELWQVASKNETLSYKDAQANFRKLIATSPSESGQAVRKAFEHAGVDIVPNGGSFRFRLKDAPYLRSAKMPIKGGGRGKVAIGLALVGGLLTAGSAAAYEPDLPKVQSGDLPQDMRTNLQVQLRVGVEMAQVADMVPGGALAAYGSLAVSLDAAGKLRALTAGLWYNNSLNLVSQLRPIQNIPYMINPSTGQIFSINIDPYAVPSEKGRLSPVNKLEKTPWGWYYDAHNIVAVENEKYYLWR